MLTSINALSAAPVVVQRPATWRDVLVSVADRLHARDDAWSLRHGLICRRVGRTGRAYRDPRFALRSVETVEEVKACA